MGRKPIITGIDPGTGYPLCKNGHVRSPENTTKQGACKQCAKEANRRFYRTSKRKEYLKQYHCKMKENPRYAVVTVRVTDEEKKQIKQRAALMKMPVSDLVRMRVLT